MALKWALGLNRWGAELLGVWPRQRLKGEPAGKDTEPWHVKLRVPCIIVLLFFWVILPQNWALSLVIGNLSLVIDNLMSHSAAMSACFKLFFLWHSKSVMWPVIELAQRDWSRPKSAWERDLMLRRAFKMRLVTIVDYVTTGVSLLGFLGCPLLGVKLRLINNITDYGDRHLLVQSYYPFDYSVSPNYELTMVLQYIGAIFAAMTITVPENYFGALVIHASVQLEILGLNLERFFGRANPSNEPRPDLGQLIERHVHLIEVMRALERSFLYVTLVQISSTSLIVCSYGFQFLAIIGASKEEAPFLQIVALFCVMLTLMVHTLVDCYVGETLASRSTSLINSIYNCHWYAITDGKNARDLIPMMILVRNQKPLTAGKILPLSLATFCSILKTTAGYISMLVAVNTK